MNFITNTLTDFVLENQNLPPLEAKKNCDDVKFGTLVTAVSLIALTSLFNLGLIFTVIISTVSLIAVHDIIIITDRTQGLPTFTSNNKQAIAYVNKDTILMEKIFKLVK